MPFADYALDEGLEAGIGKEITGEEERSPGIMPCQFVEDLSPALSD